MTTSDKYATAPYQTSKMPPGIPFIIGNEAAERFSLYGMKAILMVFMTEYLLGINGELAPLKNAEARTWIADFNTAAYFFPIFGAILADWLWGKYRTILTLSLMYCVGHAVMALVDLPLLTGIDPRWMLGIALGLIAIGSGGIKPCVSSHVGDQFGEQNQHLLTRVYQWFYFSINFGATISTFLTPILLKQYGAPVAFGIPGILMAIATLTFWLGRNRFVHIPPSGNKFFQEFKSGSGPKAILNLLPVFLLTAPFWALFDQTHAAWITQAASMDRNVFGYEVLPSQVPVLNPIMVMLFIPLFGYVIYPQLEKVIRLTPLRKIGFGLFLAASSYLIPIWVEMRIENGETPHIAWHALGHAILTAAEILVSITALEFSYTQAPKRMKSLLVGLFYMSVALGNQVVAGVNRFFKMEDGNLSITDVTYYSIFMWLAFAGAVVFVIYSQFYRGQTYIQDEELSRDAEQRTQSA